ncbi:squalene/phytoene synthase family protein [Streptomyces sp. CRN 30]|uniref:squalene/phytoene synthase family protein n=1 Tax=Streptomyces sp. CRN 30 TaxID=3075613 RepID=UPI002A803291|nr:squalene/phytoene synthase family protein [Streptomyces sp. CRN 30]
MSAWNRSLAAAGITDPELRRDYGAQRRTVARFRRTAYLAVRLLLPSEVVPHVVVMTAVMHHGDNLLDTGPRPRREAAWASWQRRVRAGLESGASDEPLIRALLHTVGAYPRLRRTVEDYLRTAVAELEFDGFATEADYQDYVDAYSLPGFMLVAALLEPEDDDGSYRAACRTFIDGSQRLDFVNDLAEDLREGRTGIPAATLERFSVPADDLAAGRPSEGLRRLVDEQTGLARATLLESRGLVSLAAPAGRPLVRALIDIELLTADAARRRGTGLLSGAAGPPVPGAVRALARGRKAARQR